MGATYRREQNFTHPKALQDLFDRQSSERGKDEVTYFYVGDVFCIHLGTKYDDFQEKIFAEISGKSSKLCVLHKKLFLCNTQSLELFPRNLCEDFFS